MYYPNLDGFERVAAYNTPVHGAVWVGAVLHAVVMVYGWFLYVTACLL